ncbi:hypothetical protein [Paraburkholderia sp. UYCP14C]|uniref:hypothetical protein n=1 Tax=Paraburkholderia sp. UYCP14C TaxID=2511130 RepID=UPI00145A0032|nr:hypothetical protein [Paraburkholderia sp. UYCP14C]
MNQTTCRSPLALGAARRGELWLSNPLVAGPICIEKSPMNIPDCDNMRLFCDQPEVARQPVDAIQS